MVSADWGCPRIGRMRCTLLRYRRDSFSGRASRRRSFGEPARSTAGGAPMSPGAAARWRMHPRAAGLCSALVCAGFAGRRVSARQDARTLCRAAAAFPGVRFRLIRRRRGCRRPDRHSLRRGPGPASASLQDRAAAYHREPRRSGRRIRLRVPRTPPSRRVHTSGNPCRFNAPAKLLMPDIPLSLSAI